MIELEQKAQLYEGKLERMNLNIKNRRRWAYEDEQIDERECNSNLYLY